MLPNILFVIGSLELGGTESQLVTLISRLQGRTHSCHVFTLQSDGTLRSRLAALNVSVHSGGLEEKDLSRFPWKVIWAGWKLFRVIRKLKPVIVHSFLPLATFMGALTGRLNKVSLVITSRRSLGKYQERYLILRMFDLLANRMSHYVTVNSKSVRSDVINRDYIDPHKLVLIYNGVNYRQFNVDGGVRDEFRRRMGCDELHKVVTVVANLIPYKGHEELLQAASIVADQIPSSIFWMVGRDRGIQNQLEQVTRSLSISNRVMFLGQRSDIPHILAASDLLVLPSHEEGFSNAILEAMAAGLPVVVTRVGGNQEAVLDGVTGWLVPPRKPEELAVKILDLLNNPEKARKWGDQGRQRAKKKFNIEKMVEDHIKLYQVVSV